MTPYERMKALEERVEALEKQLKANRPARSTVKPPVKKKAASNE